MNKRHSSIVHLMKTDLVKESYDIDFVITWVDHTDPDWNKEKESYLQEKGLKDDVRFRDWELLKYWFRGVEKFTPWVKKIHFVTYGHLPEWLDVSNPKLNVVRHEDFIPQQYLPTFNSHTIELNLHRIKGLAEHFVYFNDDVFITSKTSPRFFFEKGLPKETFAIRIIKFASSTNCMVYANDAKVINDCFNSRDVYKKHWRKLLSLKNGRKAIKTIPIILLCNTYFPGFINPHVHFSFLKSTFEEIWEIAGKVLNETCKSKFREETNVGPTLIRDWQFVKGKFWPRTSRGTRAIQLSDNRITIAEEEIRKQSNYVLCINDIYELHNWKEAKTRMKKSFEKILPDKSSFEKYD